MKFKEIKMIFLDFLKNKSKIGKFSLQFIYSSKNFCHIFQNVFILRFVKHQHYEVQKNSNAFYNIKFCFYK